MRGDRDHPLSHGYTCPKGRALPQMHHHPDRLERPLMRVDGALRPTTWEACLDDLGERLRAIIEQHGPASVGIFFGSGVGMDAAGYRMAQGLHAAIGTPAKFSPLTIDGTAKVLVADWWAGARPDRPARPRQCDVRRCTSAATPSSRTATRSRLPESASLPSATLRTHAEVWVVDPRRTETARLATHHLAPRPGTDYAVLAYPGA